MLNLDVGLKYFENDNTILSLIALNNYVTPGYYINLLDKNYISETINIRNGNGETALYLAMKNGNNNFFHAILSCADIELDETLLNYVFDSKPCYLKPLFRYIMDPRFNNHKYLKVLGLPKFHDVLSEVREEIWNEFRTK
jgi:hypothetical protein